MFKLLVGVLLVSFACAAPGLVGHYPGAVSHVSRVDVHGSSGYGYSPVAYPPYTGYPASPYGYGYPPAQSYSNRIDIHSTPIITPVSPAYGHGHGYGGLGLHGTSGYGLHGASGYGIHGTGGYGSHGASGYGHHGASSFGVHGLHDVSGYGYPIHGFGVHDLHHPY